MSFFNVKDQLDRAILEYQAQLGDFLRTGRDLTDAKDRASFYRSADNAAVKAKAQGLISKADGLLANLKSIQASGLDVGGRAAALKAQFDADPNLKALLSTDPNVLGWRTLQVVQEKGATITALVKDLYAVKKSMNAHVSQVEDLKDEIGDLDNLAQGKGLASLASSFGSWYGGNMSRVVTILGVGLAVWIFGPTLLSRTIGGAKKAVFSNPRRRRRRARRAK